VYIRDGINFSNDTETKSYFICVMYCQVICRPLIETGLYVY